MTAHKVLVPIMEGFEEIEAITIVDVLRRAGVEVVIGGEAAGPVRGSHDIEVVADRALGDIEPSELRMIVLPGGMPGAANLARSETVQSLLEAVSTGGGYTAAVCAGPIALAAAGLTAGKQVTSYPGFESQLEGATYREDRVVIDDKVVTSRGPGTVMEFALSLAGILAGADKEAELEKRMLVERPSGPRKVA